MRIGATFQSPPGFYTRLINFSDGTFEERDGHGTRWSYSASNGLGVASLTGISDRNGNSLSFLYNSAGQPN